MILEVPQLLKLVSSRSGVGKETGKPWTIVTLHDERTLENEDFMLNVEESPGALVPRASYNVKLDIRGKFVSVALQPAKI